MRGIKHFRREERKRGEERKKGRSISIDRTEKARKKGRSRLFSEGKV